MTLQLTLHDPTPAVGPPPTDRPTEQPSRPRTAVTVLPARFDTHAVDRWIRPEAATDQSIVIDAGAIRFIDAAGMAALRQLVERARVVDAHPEIRNLSSAAELTFRFCDANDLLAVTR